MVQFATQQISYWIDKGCIKPMLNTQTGNPMTAKEMAKVFSQAGNEKNEQISYNILNSIGSMTIKIDFSEKYKFETTALSFHSLRPIRNDNMYKKMAELVKICFDNIGLDFKGLYMDIEYEYDINGKPCNIKQAEQQEDIQILYDLMSHMNFKCGARHSGNPEYLVVPQDEYLKILQNYLKQQNVK